MIQLVAGIAGISLVVGIYIGTAVQRHFQQRAAVKAAVEIQHRIEAERERTEALVTAHLAETRKQKDRADAIQAQLKRSTTELLACRVSADTVRLLNDSAVPEPAPAPGGTGPAPAPVETNCAVVVESAARNYSEVCIPNAQQLEALQRWYNDLRKR